MLDSYELIGTLFIITVFFVLPFILAVILPAWGVPTLIRRYFIRKNEKLPSLKPFTVILILLAIAANLFWSFALYDRIYYHWDRTFLPYTFFWYESPSIGYGSDWIAAGWKMWHLYAIWIIITIKAYTVAAFITYKKARQTVGSNLYRKILIYSVIALTTMSVVAPPLLFRSMQLIWNTFITSPYYYQEVDVACAPPANPGPKILYQGDDGEWISDLAGNNLRQAFEKNLQLHYKQRVSPDGTRAVIPWNGDFWIYCLHTEGASKISIPEPDEITGMYPTNSFPSWSPDSKQLVLNNFGDLLLVDLNTKSTSILKPKVAFKDNHIDITAKDRDTSVQPFEIGDAHWSPDGSIFYTAFSNDTVTLRQLDPESGHDEIVVQSDKLLNIISGDPAGRWLIINESQWTTIRNENVQTKTYLFNTALSQSVELEDTDLMNMVWSPSGQLIGHSNSSWIVTPEMKEFPALVIDIETRERINVTELVSSALIEKEISVEDSIVVVEIIDFVDESSILITVNLPSSAPMGRQINGILNIETGELTILQDYPASTFDDNTGERIEPIKVIR